MDVFENFEILDLYKFFRLLYLVFFFLLENIKVFLIGDYEKVIFEVDDLFFLIFDFNVYCYYV